MTIGDIRTIRAYSPGDPVLFVQDLSAVLLALPVPPSRVTVYPGDFVGHSTTYAVVSLGGGSITLGPVLDGTDRARRAGDLILLRWGGMQTLS